MQKDEWDIAGQLSAVRHGMGVIFENGKFNIYGGQLGKPHSNPNLNLVLPHNDVIEDLVVQSIECQFESYWDAGAKQRWALLPNS